MSKRVLVTGAAGFIGAHFVRYLLAETDWKIVCLDRLDSAGDQNRLANSIQEYPKRVGFVWHDLKARVGDEVVARLVTGNGRLAPNAFDYVVHMAAGSHVDRSISDPIDYVGDNMLGTAYLLELCRVPGVLTKEGKVLYYSTDEVFGPAQPGESFAPWARFNALNPYAAGKAGGEELCPAYANCFGLRIVISHCTNIVGSGQNPEKFLPLLVRRLISRQVVPIHTNQGRTVSRYYCHHENASSAVVTILEKGTVLDGSERAGRYNIAGDVEIDNLWLARRVADILGLPLRHEMVENPPGRIRPDLRYAVDDRALRELGWEPRVKFEDGLAATVHALAAEYRERFAG